MKVLGGWYRKSLSKKNTIWHCVLRVDSVSEIAYTICGKYLPITNCDFNTNPDHKCIRCENSPRVTVKTGWAFTPVIKKLITKKDIVAEIRRLITPKTFIIHIWETYAVDISVSWESDTNISVEDVDICCITTTKKKKCVSLEHMQAEIKQLGQRVLRVCDASDALAKKAREESQGFFEELLDEAKTMKGKRRIK